MGSSPGCGAALAGPKAELDLANFTQAGSGRLRVGLSGPAVALAPNRLYRLAEAGGRNEGQESGEAFSLLASPAGVLLRSRGHFLASESGAPDRRLLAQHSRPDAGALWQLQAVPDKPAYHLFQAGRRLGLISGSEAVLRRPYALATANTSRTFETEAAAQMAAAQCWAARQDHVLVQASGRLLSSRPAQPRPALLCAAYAAAWADSGQALRSCEDAAWVPAEFAWESGDQRWLPLVLFTEAKLPVPEKRFKTLLPAYT